MKFNLIGFNFNPTLENKHCTIHTGTRLIPKTDDPDMLWCPTCGTSYLVKDSGTDEKIKSRYGPQSSTKIISAKKQKKYYDSQGNEITDETLLQDIARGAKVVLYREDKPDNTTSAFNPRNKTMVRDTK